MEKRKKGRNRKTLIRISQLVIVAIIISCLFEFKDLKIYEFDYVATTVGVFLGFGLTVYTFIIQLMQPIILNIEKKVEDKEKKTRAINSLKSGVVELREDLWVIFFSLIFTILMGITAKSYNLKFDLPIFGTMYSFYYMVEMFYTFIYLLVFRAVYDLMQSLFLIGEITAQLLD